MRIGRRAFPGPLLIFFAIAPIIARWLLWWTVHLRHRIWRRIFGGVRWMRHVRHQIWARGWAFSVRAYEWTIVHVLRRSL